MQLNLLNFLKIGNGIHVTLHILNPVIYKQCLTKVETASKLNIKWKNQSTSSKANWKICCLQIDHICYFFILFR